MCIYLTMWNFLNTGELPFVLCSELVLLSIPFRLPGLATLGNCPVADGATWLTVLLVRMNSTGPIFVRFWNDTLSGVYSHIFTIVGWRFARAFVLVWINQERERAANLVFFLNLGGKFSGDPVLLVLCLWVYTAICICKPVYRTAIRNFVMALSIIQNWILPPPNGLNRETTLKTFLGLLSWIPHRTTFMSVSRQIIENPPTY